MGFTVETGDGRFFRLDLDEATVDKGPNPDATISNEIRRMIQGQPSSASGPLTPDELQDLQADPGEVESPFAAEPFRNLSGSEKLSAAAIPTATSVAGGLMGGALAGPPGAVVGEAAGDVVGLFINVAAGLEPLTLTNLGAAAFTPLVSRSIVQAGVDSTRGVLSKTKAAGFAVQETNKNQARKIKQNFTLLQEGLDRRFPADEPGGFLLEDLTPDSVLRKPGAGLNLPGDVIPIKSTGAVKQQKKILEQAAEETQKRAENLVKIQAKQTSDAFTKQQDRFLPVMDEASVDSMFNRLNSLAPGNVPLAIFQRAQIDLAKRLTGIKKVIPGLSTPALEKLTELSKQKVASFKDVRNTLTELGAIQAGLAVERTADAGRKRFAVGLLRDALEQSLSAAARSNAVAPEARKLLKDANSAFFNLRTSDELSFFLAQFTDNVEGTIDFNKALNKFRNVRDKEARMLRKRLQKLKLVGPVDKFLDKGRQINVKATDLLGQAKENLKRAKGLGEPQRATLPLQPSLTRELNPSDPITQPSPSAVFWAALGGMSIAGAVFGATQDPLFTGVTGTGTAAIMALPWSLSRLMMTKGGQDFVLNRLTSSKGVYDRGVAGATGAFLRASMVQATASPEIEQNQQASSAGTP